MKILYIAPYKDQDYKEACANNIRNLSKKSELSILPIYIKNKSTVIDNDIQSIENKTKTLTKTDSQANLYDVVIQHAPLGYLFPFKSGVVSKNFCIPIIEYIKQLKDKEHTLGIFDKILCDSKHDSDFINENILDKNKKIKLFSYDIDNENHSGSINFGYLTKYYKFYSILNNENIQHIYNLLIAFSLAIDTSENCCLVFGVSDKSIVEKASKYIEFISEKTKIYNLKYYIKFINIDNTSTISLHKACDCLIDIRCYTNFNYEVSVAKKLNKSVISNENLDISFENLLNNDDYQIGNLYPVINTQSLIHKLRSIAKTKPIFKLENIPKLSDIVC